MAEHLLSIICIFYLLKYLGPLIYREAKQDFIPGHLHQLNVMFYYFYYKEWMHSLKSILYEDELNKPSVLPRVSNNNDQT